MYAHELIKGHLVTIVLSILKENGKMYGYEIFQKVKEQSNGNIELKEGSLYPALRPMSKD